MSRLFEQTTINGLTLKNRFVRAATWEGMAGTDGSCTQKITDVAVNLAKGGVGLIITGAAFTTRAGQDFPWQLGVHRDAMISGLAAMTQAVHQADGKIVMMLFHGGIFCDRALTGQDALGPSVLSTEKGPVGKEMTAQDIHAAEASFAEAAARAKKAGFDGVQIHACHDFLLGQFLSPFFNHRQDEYGGSVGNRARMLLATVRSVREAVGSGYPILVRINSEDLLDGGFSVNDMVQVASMLEKAGVDAMEMSGGNTMALLAGNPNKSWARTEKHHIYYEEAAKRYKAAVRTPLMLVGGSRCYQESERLVTEGITDYIAMCRPLVREPGLVKRWASGDTKDSECVSDNLCLFEGLKGVGVHCVHVRE